MREAALRGCISRQHVGRADRADHGDRPYLSHDVITGVADPRTNPVIWFAIYDEDFRKVGSDWQISRSRIQFLWAELAPMRNSRVR